MSEPDAQRHLLDKTWICTSNTGNGGEKPLVLELLLMGGGIWNVDDSLWGGFRSVHNPEDQHFFDH